MKARQGRSMDRLTELLAEEALGNLSGEEIHELEGLMAAGTGLQREDLMNVASLLQVGFLHQDPHGLDRMPDALKQQVERQAEAFFAEHKAGNDPANPATVTTLPKRPAARLVQTSRWLQPAAVIGWLAAAALALALVLPRGAEQPELNQPLNVQRTALMQVEGTTVVPWIPPKAAGYTGVTGDVVWNNDRQQGFLRLAGMPANDAAQMQYQLWIVDPDRDANPVDGGVFDIPPGTAEVIVAIDAKLSLSQPRAFAITAEQPGGVVVSGGPLLIVAPVTG
jgi:hypothetical protein